MQLRSHADTIFLGSFMNAWDIYEDLTDIGAARTHIEKQMDEYNSSTGVVRLDLILFRDAVEHICRIVRVISQVGWTRVSRASVW